MQDEVNTKVVAIMIKGGKISAEVLKKALDKFVQEIEKAQKQMQQPKTYRGKQSIKHLMSQNAAISNIEVTDGNIKSFERTASSVAESLCVELGVLESDIHVIPHQDFVLMLNEKNSNLPIYRETANYAYEAGEMEAYRASLAANEECRSAIEAAISSNYADNRLDADSAVKSVLEQFSPDRVRYVLANTIQQKDFDGRIPQSLKEWAKSVEVCPENASRLPVRISLRQQASVKSWNAMRRIRTMR